MVPEGELGDARHVLGVESALVGPWARRRRDLGKVDILTKLRTGDDPIGAVEGIEHGFVEMTQASHPEPEPAPGK